MHYVSKYQEWYLEIKKIVANCEVLDVEFKDLHDPISIRNIQEFVCLNSSYVNTLPSIPTTRKMDTSSITQEEFLHHIGKVHSDFDFLAIS